MGGDGECVARFAASAARWPDLCGTVGCEGGYDMSRYETTPEALEAYAAFHASKAADNTAQTLIFTPNQYGLGNRLRAMKSALLVAMLTGRVFRTWWHEPYPLDTLVEPARIDWRTPAAKEGQPDELGVICLPFATAEGLPKCAWHMQQLRQGDLRVSYATVQRLEVRNGRGRSSRAPPRREPRHHRLRRSSRSLTSTSTSPTTRTTRRCCAVSARAAPSGWVASSTSCSPPVRARPTPRDRTRGRPALATRRLKPRDAAAAGERLRHRLEAVLPPRPPPALAAADTSADTPTDTPADTPRRPERRAGRLPPDRAVRSNTPHRAVPEERRAAVRRAVPDRLPQRHAPPRGLPTARAREDAQGARRH